MFFRAKKWIWTKLTERRGPDSAYAKYLENFNRVQANADSALQKDLNIKALTKEEFIRVWNGTSKLNAGKSKACGSKSGCCS